MNCGSQGVEQLGVRRQLAGRAEIVDRADQSRAEEVMPHAVDVHAGRERIVRRDDPPGQLQPAAGVRRHGERLAVKGDLQHAAGNRRAAMMHAAANAHLAILDLGRVLDGHARGGGRARLLQTGDTLLQNDDALGVPRLLRGAGRDELRFVFGERRFVGGRRRGVGRDHR